MLVDSHCHLGDAAFTADVAEVVVRAEDAGVARMIVVGESPEAAGRALELVAAHPALSATAGVHPHVASTWSAGTAAWLAETLADVRVVAVGETGLDYHYDHSPRPAQREAFEAQLELARAADKPAVIHARTADQDVEAVLRNHPRTRCVLHSWSRGAGLLEAALSLGHFVSFSGMVTFRSWKDDAAVERVPLDRLLVETDAPYLAPVPHRGRRNEPAYVTEVGRRIAEVKGVTFEELCDATTANAVRMFGPRLSARSPL